MTLPTPLSTRRNFLKTTAATALLAGGFPLMSLAQEQAVNALKIPALDTGRLENGTRVYDLTMQKSTTEFYKGYQTPTFGLNGSYLGPTLRMKDGEPVRINVTNTLGEPSTLHWHGMHLPAKMDGGPHQIIRDGETWSPEFGVRQKAATLWYHAHLMGKTAEHVWHGLAGQVWIDDAESEALALPRSYGVDDIPLVLQDRNFTRSGDMPYTAGRRDMMMGLFGNTPLTNGTLAAYFDATTDKLRLRLHNASNASFYYLGFDNDQPFLQIASDGGLLETPVEMNRLLLGPAERGEIVVDLKAGQKITLRNFSNGQPFAFLEIRAADTLTASPAVPQKLAQIAWLDPKDAVKTRRFDMETRMGPGMMFGGGMHTINGKSMDINRIDETVQRDTTEIWEIRNVANMPHVWHMHDVQFQILNRNGKPPAANERARKDTVTLRGGEVVRLIMRFEDYADPDSPFMYHCHILEHEDAGMMGQFVVV